jgi:hypothetical protein
MEQQKSIKEIIRNELDKCRKDIVYFIRKYVFIQHPQRGRIPFNLYPFQEAVLKLLTNYDYNDIILKSRQLGISTLVSALALWTMLFNENKMVLVLATKQDTAKNLLSKVIYAYDNLPSWLKLKAKEKNKLSLKLSNGSYIIAVSAASDSARTYAASLLLIDEAAFIDDIEETYASAQQTLATGGKSIVLSTPNGTTNWFCDKFEEAEENFPKSTFRPIRLKWNVHPERTQAWRDQQTLDLGPKMAAQECDCDFITSGDTVFDPDLLSFYDKTYVEDHPPLQKIGFDGNYWLWEYGPDYTKQYMVVADVARGDGKDYSTFQVIDVESAKQVAEYRGQLGTTDFGNLLVQVSTQWNDAILVIENTGIGWAVIQQVISRGYKNLFYSAKNDTALVDVNTYLNRYDENDANLIPGFTNSLKTRPLLIAKLDDYLREKSCTYYSKRLHNELTKFVWKNGRAGAGDGAHDDLLFPFAIGMFIRDTILRFRQQGIDLTRAVLGGIQKSSGIGQGLYNKTDFMRQNPWRMDLPDGSQENLGDFFGFTK